MNKTEALYKLDDLGDADREALTRMIRLEAKASKTEGVSRNEHGCQNAAVLLGAFCGTCLTEALSALDDDGIDAVRARADKAQAVVSEADRTGSSRGGRRGSDDGYDALRDNGQVRRYVRRNGYRLSR